MPRTSATSTPPKEPAPTEDKTEPTVPAVNGVLVLRSESEDGTINFEVQTLGDVRITEADTILALGRVRLRQTLGI